MQSYLRNSCVCELLRHLDLFGVERWNVNDFSPVVKTQINALIAHPGLRCPQKLPHPSLVESEAHISG